MSLRFLIILTVAFLAAAPVAAQQTLVFSGPVKMGDGDSLRVGGSENLRLIDIDAPEMDQTCDLTNGAIFACGAWVADTVRAAFDGRTATCRAQRRDRYDRPLVTCIIDGEDLGARLVREGLARTYRDAPAYAEEQKAAILAARGLWAMSMQDPAEHRRARAQATPAPNAGCVIKGNISSNGRIYHRPGQEHYERTRIRPETGERWFCSEAEARAAGWRPARR
jgi:endonuclease YncB( thermonuclease family)